VGAFANCASLTSVSIPNSVTSIGNFAFSNCAGLTSIEVDAANTIYSSTDGVLFDKERTTLIQCPGGKAGSFTTPNSVSSIGDFAFSHCPNLTSVTIGNSVASIGAYVFESCTSLTSVSIPNSVTSIGEGAFSSCTSLASVTIPDGVTNIGAYAFYSCTSLTGVYFEGDVPTTGEFDLFDNTNNASVYYLPGTTGWLSHFGGHPTVLWNPTMPTDHPSFGVQANQFGFTITGPSDLVVVVEACTNLTSPNWSPVSTNTLTGGSSYFSDPQWSNHLTRVYRLRSP
jgi:hypothetical protein